MDVESGDANVTDEDIAFVFGHAPRKRAHLIATVN
jgi:hypothetical protein